MSFPLRTVHRFRGPSNIRGIIPDGSLGGDGRFVAENKYRRSKTRDPMGCGEVKNDQTVFWEDVDSSLGRKEGGVVIRS